MKAYIYFTTEERICLEEMRKENKKSAKLQFS